MAARFVYWMNVSLDLFIDSETSEAGSDWARITEPLHQEFNDRARALSMMVQGRVVFEMMESYWPVVRTDPSEPAVMREYGAIWTDAPKILVSNTRTHADHNTRVIGGPDAIEQLARVRSESEGDIGVGGATVATALLGAGLIDEIMLFTHPVILGSGRGLFGDAATRVDLDLLEQGTYGDGVTLHRYAVRGAVPA